MVEADTLDSIVKKFELEVLNKYSFTEVERKQLAKLLNNEETGAGIKQLLYKLLQIHTQYFSVMSLTILIDLYFQLSEQYSWLSFFLIINLISSVLDKLCEYVIVKRKWFDAESHPVPTDKYAPNEIKQMQHLSRQARNAEEIINEINKMREKMIERVDKYTSLGTKLGTYIGFGFSPFVSQFLIKQLPLGNFFPIKQIITAYSMGKMSLYGGAAGGRIGKMNVRDEEVATNSHGR